MKVSLLYGTAVLSLPRTETLSSLCEATKTDLKVLLYLADSPKTFDISKAAESLGEDEADIVCALSFWEKAGVIALGDRRRVPGMKKQKDEDDKKDAPSGGKILTKDALPEYTGEELASVMERNSELSSLISACQQTVGKIFTLPETRTIVGLFDYLNLSEEYILSLCAWCKSRDKTSLRYIEKTAIALVDKGINTSEALDAYIKENEKYSCAEGTLRRMFGIGQRALTSAEAKAFSLWISEWNLPDELIEYAYELTVNNTGKAAIPYTSKILEGWKDMGIKTAKEARALISSQKKPTKQGEKSFDIGEFSNLAMGKNVND